MIPCIETTYNSEIAGDVNMDKMDNIDKMENDYNHADSRISSVLFIILF